MSGPRQFIQDKWKDSQDFATEAFDKAMKAIDDISEFVAEMEAINVKIGLPSFANQPPIQVDDEELESSPSTTSNLPLIDINSYGSMGAVTANAYGDVNNPLPDTTLVSGRVQGVPFRSIVIPDFTAIMEELDDIPDNPDAPTIGVIPDVPTFAPIDFPIPPILDLDQIFNGVRPEDIPPLTSLIHPFNYVEEEYQWSYKDTIDKVVEEWLGTPESWFTLPQQYEQAIFERDKNRAYVEKENAINNALIQYSQRGFSIPDGQLSYVMTNLERELNNTLSDRSREIAFEQAKLALDNARQAFGLAVQYEQLLVSQDNSSKDRILDASKFASEFSLGVAKVYIDWYNAQVALYLADIQVYTGLLQAEMIKLEVYKTELEAISLQVRINQQTLDLYIATIDSYLKQVELYTAQIQANSLILEQNKLRIEQFTEEVQAWVAQIEGASKTLSTNVQEINLQTQKENSISSLAEDSVKRITAYKTDETYTQDKVSTQTGLTEGTLKEFTSKNVNIIKTIETDLAYVQQQAAAITSQVQRNTYLLNKTDIQNKYQLAYDELESQNILETSKIDLAQAKYNLDFALEQYKLALGALEAQGDLSAKVAAAALSSYNASAGMGSNDSFGASSTQSWSFGDANNSQAFPIIQPS